LSPRQRARWCICRAVWGRSSLTWMPVTEVGIARKGPPVSVPGFGSQLSSWLRPPCISITTMRFCSPASRRAWAGWADHPSPPAQEFPPREEMFLGAASMFALHRPFLLVLEAEFGRAQHRPDHFLDRGEPGLRARGQVADDLVDLPIGGPPRVHAQVELAGEL